MKIKPIKNQKSKIKNGLKLCAVIVAAGSSSRMGGKVRKPFLKLAGKPILSWTAAALGRLKGMRQMVFVTRGDDQKLARAAVRRAGLTKNIDVLFVEGGARRQDSVLNGLRATKTDCQVVLIHDGARPFPPQEAMLTACQRAWQMGAAILACTVKDTVKKAAEGLSVIESTLPRKNLWLAQTPQVFRRDLILNLAQRLASEAPTIEVTDDAAVCEYFKQPVELIESSAVNLKVTQPSDLPLARAYLNQRM